MHDPYRQGLSPAMGEYWWRAIESGKSTVPVIARPDCRNYKCGKRLLWPMTEIRLYTTSEASAYLDPRSSRRIDGLLLWVKNENKSDPGTIYKEAAPSSSIAIIAIIAINYRIFSSDKVDCTRSLPKTKNLKNTQQSVAEFLGTGENARETSWNASKWGNSPSRFTQIQYNSSFMGPDWVLKSIISQLAAEPLRVSSLPYFYCLRVVQIRGLLKVGEAR